MPAEQVTILIPDISGYTEFVSKAEIDHGAHILNHLLETIVNSMSEDYVVAEIEGDAVLLYKKGNPPTKQEILEQCVKTFTAFHTQIQKMDHIRICQCVACHGVVKLTLKFIVHFGLISENIVSRFTKASGIDMVIAHRLLKNSIDYPEYLLLTKNYLVNIPDPNRAFDLSWSSLQEEYASIGTVEFDFASLESYRMLNPEIPKTPITLPDNNTLRLEIEIGADYKDVLAALVDLESRKYYFEGVKDVRYFLPMTIIGMKVNCTFDEFEMELEPMSIETKENEVQYAEYLRIPQMDLYSICSIYITQLESRRCTLVVQIYPQEGYYLTSEQRGFLKQFQEATMENLKVFAENGFQMVTPAF